MEDGAGAVGAAFACGSVRFGATGSASSFESVGSFRPGAVTEMQASASQLRGTSMRMGCPLILNEKLLPAWADVAVRSRATATQSFFTAAS